MRRLLAATLLFACVCAAPALAEPDEAAAAERPSDAAQTFAPGRGVGQDQVVDPDRPTEVREVCPTSAEELAELERINPERAEACRRERGEE